MTAAGNAAEGIPRGNIRGGRDPLAGGPRTEMQHYTAHVTWTRRRAAHVTARSGMFGGAERRSLGGSFANGPEADYSNHVCYFGLTSGHLITDHAPSCRHSE